MVYLNKDITINTDAMTDAMIEMDNVAIPAPKIKHDWYQTDTHVIVTILAKNTTDVVVSYEETILRVTANLPSDNGFNLELNLTHAIVPKESYHKILPSKIEIKLKKRDGTRWITLEEKPIEKDKLKLTENETVQADEQASKYPSSCKIYTDWDKVEKEITKQEAEETEGEAAINALFQSIYGKGTDEVRRAMNKSFIESGGTVLSTNWEEVGQRTVEKKPPDGMEWKSWNS